mmetsp:Transcript_6483/g.11578  ORF Transcript_6483/g.11578 Transcript_6483/m.11578 type:complete len:227 (-) Transcript_6483:1419-2099(-)
MEMKVQVMYLMFVFCILLTLCCSLFVLTTSVRHQELKSKANFDSRSFMLNQIAVAIKTGSEVQNLRLEKLANTWMKSRPFPNVILVGDVDSPASDNILGIESFDMKKVTRSLLLNNMKIHNYSQSHIDKYINKLMKGGWEGDKDKNLPALWFLFNKFPYKRVYMLIDDDTYVFVENLLYNLQHNSVYNPFWNASFVKPAFGGNCFLFSKCLGYNNSIFTNGKRNPR